MSNPHVKKNVVNRNKIHANENNSHTNVLANTQKLVHCLRYMGNELANRDMRKLIDVVYINFEHLDKIPELNHTRQEIDRLISSPKSITIIGVINGSIVAYLLAEITATEDLRQLMHIYYIYTSPNHRGKGIATYMLRLIEKYAQEFNITTLSLTFDTHNKKLEQFYLNNNFVYDSNIRSYQRHDMMVKYI
jgi:RimJ/RimL family protein N-acetyltransferase